MKVTIKSNRQWRNFTYRYDVPARVLADQFDYQDEDETIDGFFSYRGHWYHIDQFMRIGETEASPMSEWDGYAGDSYFSGVLIKLSDDGEQYQVGTYFS